MLIDLPRSPYQVGGSLPPTAQTYVERQADETLLRALLNGEFCYIFNSRQMGKSSLRVRTMTRLVAAGVHSASIDLTSIGSQQVTVDQWYAAIAGHLAKGFRLSINLGQWWRSQGHLPPVARLSEFMNTVLLEAIQAPIVILIDEIDSILGLQFPTDDFFALIRTCYDQRAENPNYRRLTFALFGVITPGELITEKKRTPFNIGRAIALQGFTEAEATPLLIGLKDDFEHPQVVLKEILRWSGGQPFLTQKLCQGAVEAIRAAGEMKDVPGAWVDQLVYQRVLLNWEQNDNPEHLKTIRDRLWFQPHRIGELLGLYQEVLAFEHGGKPVLCHDSPTQTELLLMGLVEKRDRYLRVKNRVNQWVFNQTWVREQLDNFRPYAQALNCWVASHCTDEAQLLRGQSLQEAIAWAQKQRLSDLDYRFLAASQEVERREVTAHLEAERLQEVEARLRVEQQRNQEQHQSLRRQRVLLVIVTMTMGVAIAAGLYARRQYYQSNQREIEATLIASQGKQESRQELDSLILAIAGYQNWQQFSSPALKSQVMDTLQQAVMEAREVNRLDNQTGGVYGLAYSPDGQWFASVGGDRSIKIWRADGTLLHHLADNALPFKVAFSADSKLIAVSDHDNNATVWTVAGKKLQVLRGHQAVVWGVDFHPQENMVATASGDGTVKLWDAQGTLLHTLKHNGLVWSVDFSPDGQTLASAGLDGVKLWRLDGQLLKTFAGHQGPAWHVKFSPDGKYLFSSGNDQTLRLWDVAQGSQKAVVDNLDVAVMAMAYSPQDDLVAFAGGDKKIYLWSSTTGLQSILEGHTAAIRGLTFDPTGQRLVSGSEDGTIRIWQIKNNFSTVLYGDHGNMYDAAYSPDGTLMAVAGSKQSQLWQRQSDQWVGGRLRDVSAYAMAFSPDSQRLAIAEASGRIALWDRSGQLKGVLQTKGNLIFGLVFSPDGQWLASGGDDQQITLWRKTGLDQWRRDRVLEGHTSRVFHLAFSPDSRFIISGSADGTVRRWELQTNQSQILGEHQGIAWGVAISSDNQMVASVGRDDFVNLWHPDGRLIRRWQANTAGLLRVAFSPDHQVIAATTADNTIQLWQTDGTPLLTLNGHSATVQSLAFSPDGKYLLSTSEDQTARLWHLQTILALNWADYGCDLVSDYLRNNSIPTDDALCPALRLP